MAKKNTNPQQLSEIEKEKSHYRPLNVMYWAKNEDGTYEFLNSQQRTFSLCELLTTNNFHISPYNKVENN
jgi:hypothetical protein